MLFKQLALAALAAVTVSAQNHSEGTLPTLLELLNSTNELSTLNELLTSFEEFVEHAHEFENVTILAPSNGAMATLMGVVHEGGISHETEEFLEALFAYHILQGVHDNITDYHVLPTFLADPEFANVTGGQVVGAYFEEDHEEVGFYSGWDIHPTGPNAPIHFSGGVLYIVDGVLNIPVSVSETVIAERFNGSYFVDALAETNLTEKMHSLADATFFVPVNSGILAIEEALEKLTIEEIIEVIEYHVVPGTIAYWETMKNNTVLTTLSGHNLTIFITEAEEIFINNAGIVYTDLILANGVVHLIDNVLNPNGGPYSAPPNGTEDGVPAFAASGGEHSSEHANASDESAASATASASPSTTSILTVSTNMAAAPLASSAAGAAILLGGAIFALNF